MAGSIADDINFFMDNFTTSEWDYFEVRDPDACRSFQLAAVYCVTCSEDSSEGDYDPTQKCFMAELADGSVEEASSDDGNRREHPPANQVVAPAPANRGAVPPEPRHFVKVSVTAGATGATHGAREKAQRGASTDTTATNHA